MRVRFNLPLAGRHALVNAIRSECVLDISERIKEVEERSRQNSEDISVLLQAHNDCKATQVRENEHMNEKINTLVAGNEIITKKIDKNRAAADKLLWGIMILLLMIAGGGLISLLSK